jgi:hypothetical protein
MGTASIYAGLYNGATPTPFRFDPSGARCYTAGIRYRPVDWATFGLSGYSNIDIERNFERNLFAIHTEVNRWGFIYRGEHILGRENKMLIRAYHSGLGYVINDDLSLNASAEFLDHDRDLGDSAVWRARLACVYKFTNNISTEIDYTQHWKNTNDVGWIDLYLRAEY